VSIDVNGFDNSPEWGTCKAEGCHEDAYPIWESGAYPDDPDLLLCEMHIGREIARLRDQAAHAEAARKAWTAIGARAQADALALHTLLDDAITLCHIPEHNQDEQWYARFEAIIVAFHESHPGAALLAELEAARRVVQMARSGFGTKEDIILGYAFDPTALCAAISAYDEAVKAREM
jgi:hypothetical protein